MKDTWGRMVTVDTEIWRNRSGNGWTGKEPRGRGTWSFHFGGYSYSSSPQIDFIVEDEIYSVAIRKAVRACAGAGYSLVCVL